MYALEKQSILEMIKHVPIISKKSTIKKAKVFIMLVTSKLEELRQRLIKLYKVFLKKASKVGI